MPTWGADMIERIEALQAKGIDPYGADDSVFERPYVYCFGHLRAHTSGWCTVSTYDKLPLDAVEGDQAATDEARGKGLYIYGDPRPCLNCGAMVRDGALGMSVDEANGTRCKPGDPRSPHHDPRNRY
jgi:hypothetical protein